jgi:anthranilate 1,2-dioxygenase large subunit/terephthalate 1,2-dioxygenase oxygenase component alpha subunit
MGGEARRGGAAVTVESLEPARAWDDGGITRVPYRVYEDAAIYAREQERIFRGPAWQFLGFAAELAKPGDFFTTQLGDTPIIVVRDYDGAINAMVNRCPHKASIICYEARGSAKKLVCPYHNWTFDFTGALRGVAFRNGVDGMGGMPADFDMAAHHLVALKTAEIGGLVFGSFDHGAVALRAFLGAPMVANIERTLSKPIRILGKSTQVMHCNWKLYAENSRDTYHPSLLHSFATVFRLNRLSMEGGIEQDDAGWHHLIFAKRHVEKIGVAEYDDNQLRSTGASDTKLADPNVIKGWPEWADGRTLTIMTLFPCFNLQQQVNSLATRQMVPLGPGKCELRWTFFGFVDDTPEQTLARVRQSNMFGPAGYIALEDGTVGEFVQRAVRNDPAGMTLIEMGGRGVGPSKTRATETSVRGFWRTWRQVMEL